MAAHERIDLMFLDRVKIWVQAGAGGDGAATFRREAHVPRGGPDGGDGGRGGSVYLRVDPGQTTLRDFRHAHHFRASPGGRGAGARRHGKAGDDLYLDVPPGTAVYDAKSGTLLADLVAAGQVVMVARGGRGGQAVRMSGSGPTCFALFESPADRDKAATAVPREWWRQATRLR